MNFADIFMGGYEQVLHFIAEITVQTLELIGIFIIIIGSAKAIFQLFSKLKRAHKTNIIIDLGKTGEHTAQSIAEGIPGFRKACFDLIKKSHSYSFIP